jgi:hypothetical protein
LRRVIVFTLPQTNLHFTIRFPDLISPYPARAGAAEDGSGAEVEFSVMPGAGDAAVLDGTEGDRGVGVGTEIIEGVDDALVPDEGDAVTIELIGTAFAFLEVFGMSDGLKGHGGRRVSGIQGFRDSGESQFFAQVFWGGA